MTTRDRLLKYRELRTSNPAEAKKFLEENSTDERFLSLVKLGNTFLEGFRERLTERVELSKQQRRALQPAIEMEFFHGWAQVLNYTSKEAREAARRVLELV